MSRKSRENKAKATAQVTDVSIAQVATEVAQAVESINPPVEVAQVARLDSGKYIDMLAKEQKLELSSLLHIKGVHARQLGQVAGDDKTAQDCACALIIATESAFRKIDKKDSPVSVKAELMSIVSEQTGFFGKYIPENSLFQGLNRLGGNCSNTSVGKSGVDRWARTPRSDGRRVLINSLRLDKSQGFIYLMPDLFETGFYTRPSASELKQACEHAIRKERARLAQAPAQAPASE